MLAVRAENLSKTYTGEGAPVTVFSNLTFELPGRGVRGRHGAVGSRQVDAASPDRRDRPAGLGPRGSVRPVARRAARRASGRASATRRSASCSSSITCCPSSPPRRTSRCPDRIAGVPARRPAGARRELLERVGLADRRTHGARALSGGEQQRVALARALARTPSLLLADEPTGNLDAAASAAVFELLRELHAERGMTTILVTHNPELAKRCDRLFLMSREGISPSPGLLERG